MIRIMCAANHQQQKAPVDDIGLSLRRILIMKKIIASLLAIFITTSIVLQPLCVNASASDDPSNYAMEQYFSLTPNGTISFDQSSALRDGISNTVVSAVAERIDYMNQLVENGLAYIDSDFAAVCVSVQSRAVNAVGENTVKVTWDGTTQLYMDSSIADNLYYSLCSISDTISVAINDAMLEQSGVSPFHLALLGVSVYFLAYASSVRLAKAPGRGIILNYKYNYLNETHNYWFTSQ